MNKVFRLFLLSCLLLTQLLYTSCKKNNDDVDEEEQELITTVTLQFTNMATPDFVQSYSFKDIDGAGGSSPTIDTIRLDAITAYNMLIKVLDESKNPAVDITAEIGQEKNDHQFFYTFGSSSSISSSYQDVDANGLPVGLVMQCTTQNPTATTLTVTLKHQPGIKNNSINTGETDIAVTFPVVVE